MKKTRFNCMLLVFVFLFSTIFFRVYTVAETHTDSYFTVSVASDTLPPKAPGSLSVLNKTYTSISLKWSAASDNIGVKGYEVYRDGRKIITTKNTNYTNINLLPGRIYSYSIKAYDAAGNISDSSTALSISTNKDELAPSSPKNLVASAPSYTTIALSWEPSTDNTGIKGYEIYNNGKKIASTSDRIYVCKRLAPGTSYIFTVKAYDISGNFSLDSNSCYAGTILDKTGPSAPVQLKASSVTATEINLTWSPSSDNVKVKGYEIFCDGISIGKTGRTSLKRGNLLPGKNYSYSVRAFDDSGNLSERSSQLKVKTLDDIQPPQAPTKLTAGTPTKSSVSLKWQASSDDIKIKGYDIYCNGLKIASTTRTSYTIKGLSNLSFAVFYVKAVDLVENLSESSNTAIVILLK